MKISTYFSGLCLCLVLGCSRAEDPSTLDRAKTAIKDTASDVVDATKEAAKATKEGSIKAYDKTVEVTKEAVQVTREKSIEFAKATQEVAVEAGAVVKEKSVSAYDATKEATVKAAEYTAEVTKDTVEAAKEKTQDLLMSKEELARYDTNSDGKLDDAERAMMQEAKDRTTGEP